MKNSVILYYSLLVSAVLLSTYLLAELVLFIHNSTLVITPVLKASPGEYIAVEIPWVERFDRVYIVVDGHVNIDEITLQPISAFQPPLKVESFEHDVFPALLSEKRYMFVVTERADRAQIKMMLQPIIPYIVRNVEGFVRHQILDHCEDGFICVKLTPVRFNVNNYTQIMFIHMLKQRAEPGFAVRGQVKIFDCRLDYVNIVIITEKDWYAYRVVDPFTPPQSVVSFNINVYSRDIHGRYGEFLGETIVGVAVSVGISSRLHSECPEQHVIGIGEVTIVNNGEVRVVRPDVKTEFTFSPKVYVLRKFRPSTTYLVSVASLSILLLSLVVTVVRIARR